MTDWPLRPIFRDPRYPGGWALVVAWDYSVDGTRETTTFLCRPRDRRYVIHQYVLDGTSTEVIRRVDNDEAMRIYEHMSVHLARLWDHDLLSDDGATEHPSP